MQDKQLTAQELLCWLERVSEKMRDALDMPNVNELKSELRYELSRIEQLIDTHKAAGK